MQIDDFFAITRRLVNLDAEHPDDDTAIRTIILETFGDMLPEHQFAVILLAVKSQQRLLQTPIDDKVGPPRYRSWWGGVLGFFVLLSYIIFNTGGENSIPFGREFLVTANKVIMLILDQN